MGNKEGIVGNCIWKERKNIYRQKKRKYIKSFFQGVKRERINNTFLLRFCFLNYSFVFLGDDSQFGVSWKEGSEVNLF